jgi:hypothetical protein
MLEFLQVSAQKQNSTGLKYKTTSIAFTGTTTLWFNPLAVDIVYKSMHGCTYNECERMSLISSGS